MAERILILVPGNPSRPMQYLFKSSFPPLFDSNSSSNSASILDRPALLELSQT